MADNEQVGNNPLRSFGEELRREREIRGISVKEIAEATKVSARFLEAIERSELDRLPAPVFTRGFVREYAKYLGLNADETVNRYMYSVMEWDKEGEKGRFGLRDPGDKLMGEPPASPGRWPIFVALAVALIVVIAGIWWFRGRPAVRRGAERAPKVTYSRPHLQWSAPPMRSLKSGVGDGRPPHCRSMDIL